MKRIIVWCAGVLAAIALNGCASLPKHIANYDEVVAKMDRVVVMPPTFTLRQVGMFSAEGVSEMNHDIALATHDAFEQIVAESRYKLARLDVSDEALATRPELRQRLGENSKAIDAAFARIARTKGKVMDVDFGSSLDAIADEAGADYLLMIGGGGWFKSGGTRVAEALIFGASAGAGSSTTLRAMLVDAGRGKVIWYNQATVANNDPRKPSRLLKTAQKLMKPLTGESRIVPVTSDDHRIIDKYKDLGKARTTTN